jgi:hypothetical protein
VNTPNRPKIPGAVLAAIALLVAFVAGLLIPAHGIWKVPSLDDYSPAPGVSNGYDVPDPEGSWPNPADPRDDAKVSARSISAAKANVTPWFENWQFQYRDVCIESNIAGAPLAAVGSTFRKNGMNVYVRFSLGACALAGFPKSQTIPFQAYTGNDKLGEMRGACAYTQAANYGTLTGVYIRINVTAGQTTYCGDLASGEWEDVFEHEAGHAFGLSHEQPYVSSIMRDGHTTSPTDVAYLGYIYNNNPHLILKH